MTFVAKAPTFAVRIEMKDVWLGQHLYCELDIWVEVIELKRPSHMAR